MKDNYSEMNVDMEQILFSKNYEDLTAAELDEIKDFVSSKEEFNLMKSTLMSVKTSFGTEEEIEPVDGAKENLMKMFEQKHGKVIPMNKPRPFYLNPIFQVGVAALFVLGIIYFYPKGENASLTAMNDEKNEKKEEATEDKDIKSPEETTSDEAVTEETVSPALEKVKEAEEDLKEEIVSEKKMPDTKPGFYSEGLASMSKPSPVVSDDRMEVSDKDLVSKDAKFSSDRYDAVSADSTRLFTSVDRSSNEKSKVKADSNAENFFDNANGDEVATGTTTTFTNSVATGGIAVLDEIAVAKKESKNDSEKDSSKSGRTNSAGGYYMQPAKASDMKEGVSLKDQPALAEFLFTAL